jgi:predicted glutamine amidotransferase
MCELFAMSTRHPSTVVLSLEEFSRHGGQSGSSKDGWGIAWYEDNDIRLIKEAFPAAGSACVRFVQEHPFHSPLVISHIRKATRGEVATRNCQPFIRELGGLWHSFAHNGDLAGLNDDRRMHAGTFRPVGETDSELAFCVLLERLQPLWRADVRPGIEARLDVVTRFAAELRELGPANFLYSDGDALFAHAHRRHQSDGTIRAPGLWSLSRRCEAGGAMSTDGLSIVARGAEQDVLLVASVPLTSEAWMPLAEGAVLAAQLGHLVTPG